MKTPLFGIVGIVLGLIAFWGGLASGRELGFIFVIAGIFLFGCGLIAGAIGMRN